MLEYILQFVFPSSILIAAISWLIKSLISIYINKDIESYKIKLQERSNKEIEELKSNLQIVTHEKQTAYSSLYQKRAELLSELYGLVNELHGLGYQFGGIYIFGSNKRAKDRANDAHEKIREVQLFFLKNIIYFPLIFVV